MTTIVGQEFGWDSDTEVVIQMPKEEARALIEAAVIAQAEGPWAELAAAEARLRAELDA